MILTIVSFILILALLVLVHEFGHFIAAKKNGVKVEEFGFGFPPRLWGIKKGETLYSINLIPLGGFVKLYGEEYHEGEKEDKSRAFIYKKPWQKTIIIVAGIIGNFLLGWVLISFLYTQGVPTPTDRVIVQTVQKGSPAQNANLVEGDSIDKVLVNGKTVSISSSNDLISLSHKYEGQAIGLVINHDGKVRTTIITPRKNPPVGQGPLGVVITNFVVKKYAWYQAPFYGLIQAFNITKEIVTQLGKTVGTLLTFQKPQNLDVAGPIGIAQYTGQAIKFGSNAVLELIALLSLNLAVINILPFPALDGGRLVFVIYEWVTRRRVNKKVEQYSNLVGIVLLLSLAIAISINDIVKIYKR